MEFLGPLISSMTQQEPEARPSAEEVVRRWHEIRSEISGIDAFWRFRGRNEVAIGSVVLDTVSLVQSGARATQHLLHWATGNSLTA